MINGFRQGLICLFALAMLFFQGLLCLSECSEMTADDILRHLRARFAEINDYTVLLQVETDIPQVHVPQMEVRVFFKQPDKLHLQSKGFAMLPREGMIINPNRFKKEDFYMSILGKETLKGIEAFKLELAPRKEGIKLKKLVIWVDPVRWITLKARSITWQGQSIDVAFEYKKFQGRHWLPVNALAKVDMKGFKGFSSFHDSHGWGNETTAHESKGKIIVKFLDYRINKGIPDSIFRQEQE